MFPILKRICSKNTLRCVQNATKGQKVANLTYNIQSTNFILPNFRSDTQNIRCKTKKSRIPQKEMTETESEEQSNDDDTFDGIQDKQLKVMKITVPSLRVDAVLKKALGISRNKIDLMFYENKIRVNGEKLLKKNTPVNEGDDIDLIKSTYPANPDNLIVARVELLSCTADDDNITIKIRRNKSLIVENYPGPNAFK